MHISECLRVAGVLVAWFATAASGQPTTFLDLGVLTPPASPPSSTETVNIAGWIDQGTDIEPGETVTVKWARFSLANPLNGPLYFDAAVEVGDANSPVQLALYDNTGRLITVDGLDSNQFGGAGLSFGSNGERVPVRDINLFGQDGPLSAGTYWLALIAGTTAEISLGTNWNVRTTASFQAGELGNPLDFRFTLGNTTFPTAPSNDLCANAITIGEDVGSTPAWQGVNIGATQDGSSPCFDNGIPRVTTKNVWLRYVPTRTGQAQILLTGTAINNGAPTLSLFQGGCGTAATKCQSAGSITLFGGPRELVSVTAGVPLLISVSTTGGAWGELQLSIGLVQPPCNLETPSGAIAEPEPCGQALNNGCEPDGGAAIFSPILPNQTVLGTIFTGTSGTDIDWYKLVLDEPIVATISFRSQAYASLALFDDGGFGSACPENFIVALRTQDFLNPCVTRSTTRVLEAGNHYIGFSTVLRDPVPCGSGYNQYWIQLEADACDRPVTVREPENTVVCLGKDAVLSVLAESEELISYRWEYQNPIEGFWRTLEDGPAFNVGSESIIEGSASETLTIRGVDAAAAVGQYRVRMKTCGTRISGIATLQALDVLDPRCCPCPADFDRSGGTPDTIDIDAFFTAWLTGEPSADADCSEGTPDTSDIDEFFRTWLAGGC